MLGYKVKDMKTTIYCSMGNVALYLIPERNCFLEYHEMEHQTVE